MFAKIVLPADKQSKALERIHDLQDASLEAIPSDPLLISYPLQPSFVKILSRSQLDLWITSSQAKVADPLPILSHVLKRPASRRQPIHRLQPYDVLLKQILNLDLDSKQFQKYCEFLDGCHRMPTRACHVAIDSNASQLDKNVLSSYKALKQKPDMPTMGLEAYVQGLLGSAEGLVKCPYTLDFLDLAVSHRTEVQAKNFIAIAVFLATLTRLDVDNLVGEFLVSQEKDYLKKAEAMLLHYKKNPNVFAFTPAQKNFLIDCGLQVALEQYTSNFYLKLWNKNSQPNQEPTRSNLISSATALLKDYTKADACWSSGALFFHGNWRRHHRKEVNAAIQALNMAVDIPDLKRILDKLESDARAKHKTFNQQGSLSRRLTFIRARLDSLPPQGKTLTALCEYKA